MTYFQTEMLAITLFEQESRALGRVHSIWATTEVWKRDGFRNLARTLISESMNAHMREKAEEEKLP